MIVLAKFKYWLLFYTMRFSDYNKFNLVDSSDCFIIIGYSGSCLRFYTPESIYSLSTAC